MLKNATNQDKWKLLNEWLPYLTKIIKADLKNDHLKLDPVFAKKFFPGKNINKMTPEELAQGYKQAVQQEQNGDEIVDFMFNRWLLKNSEIYQFFEEFLQRVHPTFTELELLENEVAEPLMEASVSRFGAVPTYMFAVVNSVVFPEKIYVQLRGLAEKMAPVDASINLDHKDTVAEVRKACEEELARLTDRYEKKLQGLQKKYIVDTDALKKQISMLQRKLHANK